MTKKASLKTISSGFASNTQLNSNFEALNNKLENTLSLDGSTPNSMGADLDMNGNDIINAGSLSLQGGQTLESYANNAAASATAAESSATAAASYAAEAQALSIRQFAERSSLVEWVTENTPADGLVFSAGDLFYQGSVGATDIADLPGLIPKGITTPEHFGAAGDGVVDDGAAISALYQYSRTVKADGIYRIVDRTINVTHPTTTEGVGSFVFEDMGGFTGKDGFDVSVALTAPYKSTTSFLGVKILTSGEDGKSGIKTPFNVSGGGNNLFKTVSPRFVFRDLTTGGDTQRSTSANLHTTTTWFNHIDVGESDHCEFRSLTMMGSFYAPDNPLTWGDKINTSGIRLRGQEANDGAGPIRNPVIGHIICHGMGAPVRASGYISSPRLLNMDTFANYYGGVVHTGAVSSGGVPALWSEASITNVQFNGIAGGCKIQAADYMTITDSDITDTSFGTGVDVDYSSDWIGVEIEDFIVELTMASPRFYAARASATNNHKGIVADLSAMTGRAPFINCSSVFIKNATTVGESAFPVVFDINDAAAISIEVGGIEGNITDLINLDGTNYTSPRLNLYAQKTGAIIGELVTKETGVSFINVRNLAAPISGDVAASSDEIPQSVIEMGGSSSSDRWVKYEGGWMEQIRVFSGVDGPDTATGSIYTNTPQTFTFSEAFIEPPTVSAEVRSSAVQWANARPLSSTQGEFRVLASVSSGASLFVEVKISGRWK